MSCFRIRPSGPDPEISDKWMPFYSASLLAIGLANILLGFDELDVVWETFCWTTFGV